MRCGPSSYPGSRVAKELSERPKRAVRVRVKNGAPKGPVLTRAQRPVSGAEPKLLMSPRLRDPSAAANFLASLLEASTEYSIIGSNLEGGIELWNEGARRLYGYEPGAMIDKANASILHTADDIADGLPQKMMRAALEVGSFEGKVVRRRGDGTTFTARVVMTPRRDRDGIPIGFLVISKDISDETRLNLELIEANDALLDANHHKTTFLANMSHELRTPLNAILGFSELLIDSTEEQFPAATRARFLEQIHTGGKHLLSLINDILDLSKVEAGQMELRLQTVSVATVVGEACSALEPLIAQKRIHLDCNAESAGEVLADEGKLKQMVLNLVSNAIKFTSDGGTVKVTAARVGDRLEIVVEDDGIGIAERDLPRMFKEFQQVDAGASRRQQGTGLGLALTRRFAILHGGDVRVDSTIGKGSRFTIDIPAERRSVDGVVTIAKTPAAKAVNDTSRPLVLIVEDDPASAELLARQIERAGFRTEIARTGIEALTIAKVHKPVAITLDIMLPDMDGWEILRRLKDDEGTSPIPAIVVSVVDNPELGSALGAIDFFVKPVDAKDLVKQLSKINLKRIANGGRTCVLVVDDEPANRNWLKRVLEPAGFEVTLATTGREAIEAAKAGKPDIVMLDLAMPEVDGFAVVEALSDDHDTKAIPIVVLTAKHLTNADIGQLGGRVSTVLRRESTGAIDLIGQLQVILNRRAVEV
jgi:PAS domain S-box-containing protein